MALDIMYVLLIIAWAGICVGFFVKDYAITSLFSIFLVVWGVKVLMEGLVGFQDWMTDAFAIVNLMVALYVFIRGGYELYKDM